MRAKVTAAALAGSDGDREPFTSVAADAILSQFRAMCRLGYELPSDGLGLQEAQHKVGNMAYVGLGANKPQGPTAGQPCIHLPV